MKVALLCASLSLTSTCPLWAATTTGVVTKVSDGDTVWVQPDADGPRLKLRVLGIDAPEICQLWGEQAQAALASKILHQHVQIDGSNLDQYGRLLATVTFNGQDMGQWMVSQGHAWSYRFRNSQGPYIAQETQARGLGLGLFSQTTLEEPRVFRQTHGPCR
jgi:micrococcal nuclease